MLKSQPGHGLFLSKRKTAIFTFINTSRINDKMSVYLSVNFGGNRVRDHPHKRLIDRISEATSTVISEADIKVYVLLV